MTRPPAPGGFWAGASGEPSGAPTREAVLAEIEDTLGYHVCTPEGIVLGRLAWLRYGFRDGRIEALMVRPGRWRGLFSAHEQSIASERIESVTHRMRRVIVSPLPAAVAAIEG